MIDRSPFPRTSRDLLTEHVRVGVTFETKQALNEAARRAGKPVAVLVREAVEQAVENTAPAPLNPRADQ
jgi:predicted DNA-binding protein